MRTKEKKKKEQKKKKEKRKGKIRVTTRYGVYVLYVCTNPSPRGFSRRVHINHRRER